MLTANPTASDATSSDRRWLLLDELYAVDGKTVAGVCVDHGQVWLTVDGQDLILSTGDRVAILTNDCLVMQAVSIGGAKVHLDLRSELSDEPSAEVANALPAMKL